MARVVLRLKLALYRSQLRKGGALAGFVVQVVLALGVAVWLAAGLARHEGLVGSGEPLVVAAFTIAPVYWLLTALLAVGTGDLLPIPQLRAFPLTRRQLVAGLFAASLVGLGAWITLIALLGAVRGFAWSASAVPIATLAVLVEVALCLALLLLVRSLVAVASVGRRGRDRATLLSFLVGLVAWAAYAAAGDLMRSAVELRPSPVLDALAALPPGALGHAVVLAGDGQLGAAALLVGYGALGLAAAVAGLAWALGREPRVTGGRTRAAHGPRTGLALLGPLRLPRPGRTSGVLAAELRQQRRDPRRVSLYLFGVFLSLAWTAPVLLRTGHPSPYLAALVCAIAPNAVATTQLSYEGEAAWFSAVAAGRARPELLGKGIAVLVVLVPLAAAVGAGLVIYGGGANLLPAVLACCLAACAVWLGMGAVFSVRWPAPVPQEMWRSAGQRGIGAWLVFPVAALLLVPILGAVALSRVALGYDLPGALAALAYGLALWWLGLRWAADQLERRRPEIVELLRRP